MSYVLLFETDEVARFIKTKVKDGVVNIDDKTFFIDKAKPIMLKTKLGYSPLYILKWSDVEPARNVHTRKLTPVNPKFKEIDDKTVVTPELFRRLIGLKILGNMIKPKREISTSILIPFLAIAVAISVIYMLYVMKVI